MKRRLSQFQGLVASLLLVLEWNHVVWLGQSFGLPPSTRRSNVPQSLTRCRMSASGDKTRGAAVLLEEVSVYRGPACIIQDVNWRIEPRTKWALVGANGAGKSTLLQAISDAIPYQGNIWTSTIDGIGYLRQTAVASGNSNRTIYEEAASGMTRIYQASRRMEEATNNEDWDALERATVEFEALGGHQQEQKVASVLKGLGFVDAQAIHTVRCSELSGGWQMRVAFARLLLSEPTLCLMDEPSNHLDASAKKWLCNYLRNYEGEGSMILVTHDVQLLQSMDHIAEVVPGGANSEGGSSLQIYKSCTYDQYLELKQQRAEAAQSEYERNTQKAAKLQGFVDRFGASATKASAAQSRVKMLEKMKREGLLDAPAQAVVVQRFRPSLVLPEPPSVGAVDKPLLSLRDASLGYGDKSKPLLSSVNLDITPGMKILVRGPNGAGKSTVLHALRGSLPLLDGERKASSSLRLGVFTQDLAQELDPSARAVDVVTQYAREGLDGNIHVSEQEARGAMGRLGLQGEKALSKVGDLSGGEKARVALAMFSLKASNLFLFDEASNHLDVECVEALSRAMSEWGGETGSFVVVSHDRNFCDQIEFTHVATVKDGKLTLENRGAREEDWVVDTMWYGGGSSGSTADDEDQSDESGVDDIDPKLRKKAYNAPKRIAKLEVMIEEMEEELESIDAEMLEHGSDVGKLVDLTEKRGKIETKIMELMEEWEELEELLAAVA